MPMKAYLMPVFQLAGGVAMFIFLIVALRYRAALAKTGGYAVIFAMILIPLAFLIFSFGVILANLLADCLYFYLDPRVQSK